MKYKIKKEYIALILILLTLLIATAIIYNQKNSNPITGSKYYKICSENPNSECMSEIAISLIPENYKFQILADDAVQSFVHAGKDKFIKQNMAKNIDPKQNIIFEDQIKAIELMKLAQENPEPLNKQAYLYDAKHYYNATIWTLYGHYKFNSGNTYLTEAEEAIFKENTPITFSKSLNSLFNNWQNSISKEPIVNRQYALGKLSEILLEAGHVKRAYNIAIEAYELPTSKNPRDLAIIMAKLNESKKATNLVNQIKYKETQINTLIRIADIMFEKGNIKTTNIILSRAEELIFEDNQQYKYTNYLKKLILINSKIKQETKAAQLAEKLYKVAEKEDNFTNFNLLDAAWGFYYANQKDKAYLTVHKALKIKLDTESIVAINYGTKKIDYKTVLKDSLNIKAAKILCQLDKADEAIEIGLKIAHNSQSHINAAKAMYSCLYDKDKNNTMAIDEFADKFKLNSLFEIYILDAELKITNGQKQQAIQAIEYIMENKNKRKFRTTQKYNYELLRLTIALKREDLTQKALKKIMKDIKKLPNDMIISKALIDAAAIIKIK